jgi:RNA polymerase sigma-70 factor (ECF subfamily)
MGSELRSKLESMDLAQDVLFSALQDLGKFEYRSEGDFVRWLAKVSENRIRDNLDKLHAGKRDVRKEVRLDHDVPTTAKGFAAPAGPVATTTPSAILSKREELERLSRAIETLKDEYREVVLLTKIEGLSYGQIGNRVGKSAEAVRKLCCRAMAALSCAFETV